MLYLTGPCTLLFRLCIRSMAEQTAGSGTVLPSPSQQAVQTAAEEPAAEWQAALAGRCATTSAAKVATKTRCLVQLDHFSLLIEFASLTLTNLFSTCLLECQFCSDKYKARLWNKEKRMPKAVL